MTKRNQVFAKNSKLHPNSRRSPLHTSEPLEPRLLLSILYVDPASPGPLHDGSSWPSAYPDLQPALLAAQAGDEIRLATGTYKPTSTTDRTQSFRLKSGVSLLGGYPGSSSPTPDTRNPELFPTTLSGEIGDPTKTADNSYHVVYAEDVDATTLLDGLTITAGYTSSSYNDPNSRGGGLYNINSSPTLTNCTFSNNTAAGDGAAIYNYASSPSLTACTFSKNWAWGGGGGMYNDASRPTLTDCTFSGGYGYWGGGMYNTASSPTLANCIFRGNSAEVYGGGMYNLNTSSPTLTNCTFTGNRAKFGGGMTNENNSVPTLSDCTFDGNTASDHAGGMYNISSSPTLTNCTFKSNNDRRGGAGMYNIHSSSPTLINCTFTDNRSDSRNGGCGGGMCNDSSSPTLVNCTFSANGAINNDWGGVGGGMYNYSSSPRLINCTFAGNYATGYQAKAGGIYNASSSPILTNCILWGNTLGNLINEGNSTPTVTYSLIQGGYEGLGNFDADPQFLRNPTSGPSGYDYGDLRLSPTSPAINAGLNSALPPTLTTDLAGNPRIFAVTVDLGAYELQVPTPKTIYVDQNATGSNTGTSWPNAFTELQSALAASATGDTIRIADGTYKPTSTTNRAISFALKNGVALYGGYAGFGAPNPDARDIGLYPTILSGDIGKPGDNSDNSYHVATGTMVGSSTILDGITITLGNANGSESSRNGGGLYLTASSPTLVNCRFVRNSAGSGGGMYDSSSSSPTLTNCTFAGNSAWSGGGIYNDSSSIDKANSCSPTLTNCIFVGNSSAGAYGGGAMYNVFFSSPTLTNCTFAGNSADSDEGAMYIGSSLTLTNCIFWGNSSANNGASPTVTYSLIQGSYTGNLNIDPQFVRSPWPGPDGKWGTDDDDYGDLRLRPTSPALNAGSNAALPLGLTTDVAGNPRIQGDKVDLGAYEGAVPAPAPKIIYVDQNATGAMTGTSWRDAYTSLQSALATSVDGDTIRIADGTYEPTTTTDRTISFALRNAVALYGGYAGFGAPNPDARDLALYPTILSGDIGKPGDNSDNSSHVVTGSGVGSSTILDGIAITLGNANGSGSIRLFDGSGLYLTGASPTLINCRFVGNSAAYGAMYNTYSSSPTLTNCTFIGNNGGAMYNVLSSPTLTNCTLVGNSGSLFGGIYNSESSPTLTNCIIWGNSSGISKYYNDNKSNPIVTYCDIQGGYSGTGNLNADPQFVRSPWAGPDGRFGTADDDYGDLRLRTASPVLNIGSNAAIPAGTNLDLAGHPRIQDGTVDLGAYEGALTVPAPKIMYVDQNATGSNTGTSWADAYTSLQSALVASVDGDTIRIADGTYKPTTTTDRTISFSLKTGVALYGGYAGFGVPNPDARDIALYPTILSGDINKPGDGSDNSYHVLAGTAVGSSTILDGITITLGNANGSGFSQGYGGGLYLQGSSPMLIHCTFVENSALNGGGMYNLYSSSPTLADCSFTANLASSGGGMYNGYSSPTLTNCSFTRNSATGDYSGGGMHNYQSSPSLSNCTFAWNSGTRGGGMYNGFSSSPTLANCTFTGNSATGQYGCGGGMADEFSSSPSLTNCLFVGNSASVAGGGIYDFSGGQTDSSYSPPVLTNCTIVGNSAPSDGGIYCISSFPMLTNCILWANTAQQIGSIAGVTLSVTYTLIQGGYEGLGNLDADPLFVRNPSPGPDAKWGTADDDYGDLRLQPTSPARNAGLNAALPSTLTTDLAGNPRICDRTVDLGAYESPSGDITLTGSPTDSFLLRLTDSTLEIFRNTAPTQSLPFSSLTHLTLQGGHYTLASPLPGLNLSLESDTQALLTSPQHLASLTLAGNATLDLSTHPLIVSATPATRQSTLSSLSTWINNARGPDASWLHPGVGSSAAHETPHTSLAILLNEKNGKPIYTTFAAQTVTENDILIKYTWAGDVNLDGKVDASDYFLVDSGFITQQGTYQHGDLNFDGKVDASDYFLIDSAFIAQSGVLTAAPAPAPRLPAPYPPRTPSVLAGLFSTQPLLQPTPN